jgi:hypothetical protein
MGIFTRATDMYRNISVLKVDVVLANFILEGQHVGCASCVARPG